MVPGFRDSVSDHDAGILSASGGARNRSAQPSGPYWYTTAEALLGVRLGLIDRAHDLVQDASSGLEAYIHGMIHRLEGDYWNANYWFRSAGKSIVSQVASATQEKGLLEPFDPSKLVERVEQLQKSGKSRTNPGVEASKDLYAIREHLEHEWWAVWSLVVFALS